MVVGGDEHALLHVLAGLEKDFEDAFGAARPIITPMPGFQDSILTCAPDLGPAQVVRESHAAGRPHMAPATRRACSSLPSVR
ncbi:hypothetical protein DBR22_22185 [Arthrobacter sp. HMWF013]|nr:hypothetical protein DBR22_22185 [Arthrobacter sp. HMWF013]